jgi:hypothetical protein
MKAFPDQEIDGMQCIRNNNINWKGNAAAYILTKHPPLPNGNGYDCFKMALHPLFFGLLTLKTGPNPERYEIAAVELERRDGMVYAVERLSDRLVKTPNRQGRVLIIPPAAHAREFLLVMRYRGPKSGGNILIFEGINSLIVGMMGAGKTAVMEGAGSYLGKQLGGNAQEREIVSAIAQFAMSAAAGDDDFDSADQLLNGLVMAMPHLNKDVPPLTLGMMWNTYQEFKSQTYKGFDRSYAPWKPYGG